MARDSDEVVQVAVERVVFQSEDGRFTVLRGSTERNEITVVGSLGEVAPGMSLRLVGRFTEHPTYGPRFKADTAVPIVPTTGAGIARYLGSGLVPGVGKGLATRLVTEFGERTLDVICHESARLRTVEGIGEKRASRIRDAVISQRVSAETLAFLHSVGLGPAHARRVIERYGEQTIEVVRSDPYLLAEDIHGIGFRTTDDIGKAQGIDEDDPRRAQGAILHLIGKAADAGHVCTPSETLVELASDLSVPEARARDAIATLAARQLVIVEEGAVYAPPLHRAEVTVAHHLAILARAQRRVPDGLERALAGSAAGDLSKEQQAAVRATFKRGLVVITGGPGTGKTTTLRAIVQTHEHLGRRVLLAAPTGRAAKRMTEASGREARTIHRLLEWRGATGGFARGRSSPLEAELVIIDESSMLDVRLAASLLSAVAKTMTLVLVGDVDQLPPVGAGQVLRELLASEVASVIRLTNVFRQAQRSAIVRGAHAILRGEQPEMTPSGTQGEGDLFFVRATDPEAVADKLAQLLERMPEAYGIDPRRDVQVMSPMRRGPSGTEALNQALRRTLNPRSRDAAPHALAEGDKVMQLKNDYEREVFNGDVGWVRRVEGGITYVNMDGREVQYTVNQLDALTLAYACTVHKVQGSEFAAVCIVLQNAHYVLLSRALLYTAITRARQLVVLVGDERAVRRAIRNDEAYRSRSRLVERIRGEC